MITFVAAFDAGQDRIIVHGLDDAQPWGSQQITAMGWVSAMTHHYPPEAYAADGSLLPSAVAREMTAEEKSAYFLRLLGAVREAAGPVPLKQIA